MLIHQKRPLLPSQVWAIRARLELADNLRDLALFNLAIDSKLQGCDLVRLKVMDLVAGSSVRHPVSVIPRITGRPVRFDVSEIHEDRYLLGLPLPSCVVRHSCSQAGSTAHRISRRGSTHASFYRKTGNLCAVQLLLGHTKLDSTARYLGVELDDVLSIAEKIDI